jgi:hypothetical protein
MRHIAVLLTAILSLSCAAHAGGIWGEPAEIGPTTGSTSDPLVGQANVTAPIGCFEQQDKWLGERQDGIPATTPSSK